MESVNKALLEQLNPSQVAVEIQRVGGAELDEMWSYVGRKDHSLQRGGPTLYMAKSQTGSWPSKGPRPPLALKKPPL